MKNYSLCKIVWKHISCWETIEGWFRFFSNNHYMDYKPILLLLSIMHKTGILHDTLNNVLAKLVCRIFIIIHDTYSRQNCILASNEFLLDRTWIWELQYYFYHCEFPIQYLISIFLPHALLEICISFTINIH